MRRVRVVLVDHPQAAPEWGRDVIAAIGERHDVAVYDETKPLVPQFAGVEVVVDLAGRTDARYQMMDAADKARLWQLVSVGYDHIDLDYARRKGIAVSNCPGSTSAPALAEAVIMLMLMLVRKYKECQEMLHQGRLYLPMGSELGGRILGIIGFGASGQALARLAKAFGMHVMIVEPRPIAPAVLDEIQPLFVGKPEEVDRLIAKSDFISMHVPLTPATRGMMDARRIGLMKPTAYFINVARAGLADDDALYEALKAGRIAGVGTDVYADTGRTTDDPIFQHPNLIALPHIAGGTTGSEMSTTWRRAMVVAENIDRVAEGLEPKYRVDY